MLGGSTSKNVSRSRNRSGPSSSGIPAGMIDCGDGSTESISSRLIGNFLGVLLNDDHLPVHDAAGAGEHASRCQDKYLRRVIGIEGKAGLGDIAEHGVVIAVRQIGKVGPDLRPFAVNLMALRAAGLLAEKLGPPAEPVAAFELRQVAIVDELHGCIVRFGPWQQEAVKRQRAWPVVLVREIVNG